MPKNITPIIIASLVGGMLLIGGLYALQSKNKPLKHFSPPSYTQQTPTPKITKTTFMDLLKAGGSFECQWDIAPDLEPAKLWTHAGRGRVTIVSRNPARGDLVETNSLVLDEKIYSWVDIGGAAPIGFVMDLGTLTKDDATAQQKEQARLVREELALSCLPWTVDETKFIVPPEITFQPL